MDKGINALLPKITSGGLLACAIAGRGEGPALGVGLGGGAGADRGAVREVNGGCGDGPCTGPRATGVVSAGALACGGAGTRADTVGLGGGAGAGAAVGKPAAGAVVRNGAPVGDDVPVTGACGNRGWTRVGRDAKVSAVLVLAGAVGQGKPAARYRVQSTGACEKARSAMPSVARATQRRMWRAIMKCRAQD